MTEKLLNAATSNGAGPTRNFAAGGEQRSEKTIAAYGTWDGATVTIELSTDGGTTWVPSGLSFTADGAQLLTVHPDVLVRASLSGAGATTSITVDIT